MNAHGWKMYLAGAAAIVAGLNDALVKGQYSLGIKEAIAGLAIIGLSSKLAKLILALTGGKVNLDGL